MRKHLISICLAISMLLVLCPAALADASGELLSEDESQSGGGWAWDHTAHTLTLSGCNLSGGFHISGDCTVVLTAGTTNVINNSGDGSLSASGNLVIKGGGSLVASGIGAYGRIELESGNIDIIGIESLFSAGISGSSFTMKSGKVDIKDCMYGASLQRELERDAQAGSFNVTGGEVNITVKAPNDDSKRAIGIYAEKIDVSNGKITIAVEQQNERSNPVFCSSLSVRNSTLTWSGSGEPVYGFRLGAFFDDVTIDHSEVRWLDQQEGSIYQGQIRAYNRLTITGVQKGTYNYNHRKRDAGTSWYQLDGYTLPEGAATLQPAPTPVPAPKQLAYATDYQITVDGKPVSFDAYALKDAAGNDTNYLKLRDVAHILNGTSAQFEVGWDGRIAITTDMPYTDNGSEMSTPFSGNQEYKVSTSAVVINGQPTDLNAILLTDSGGNGYTYFKLRDLGDALGFSVDWSVDTGITIKTR